MSGPTIVPPRLASTCRAPPVRTVTLPSLNEFAAVNRVILAEGPDTIAAFFAGHQLADWTWYSFIIAATAFVERLQRQRLIPDETTATLAAQLFNEGKACILKCNPVNAYLGPLVEEAFGEAIDRGWLRVVYGGAEEGGYLAHHPGVDEIHVTGSDRTHDALLWGAPGPEREERKKRGTPLLGKDLTSELGNVTPVLVVPGAWTDRELEYQADNVAGMVTHNASFNCIAGKMLVLNWGDKTPVIYSFGDDGALDGECADGSASETLTTVGTAALPMTPFRRSTASIASRAATGR